MRIAIVDDVTSDRNTLRHRLESLLKHLQLHADIIEFENGKDFLDSSRQKAFTLAFLDVYMKGIDGIETAKILRRFDPNCILVFTTSSTDHALEGFRVRATQYLVKPYEEGELKTLFDEILQRLTVPDQYIELSTGTSTIRLRLHDIIYAEHFRHQIHIWTTGNNQTIIRLTFREFMEYLTDERFFSCNRGTVINLEYVQDFDGSSFLLKNGKKVPVSRNLSKAARQALGDFLFKRGWK